MQDLQSVDSGSVSELSTIRPLGEVKAIAKQCVPIYTDLRRLVPISLPQIPSLERTFHVLIRPGTSRATDNVQEND